MRSIKLLLAGVLVAGGTVTTAAPADAYCDAVLYALTGRCTNAGCIVTGVWNRTAEDVNEVLADQDAPVRVNDMYCYM